MTGKDARLYARFSLDFPDSPKIAPLSDAAFRALVEMTCYSRRMLSDGFLDERIVGKRWKPKIIAELLNNDPDRPSLFKVPGGVQIHDFAEHQQTRADIEAKREAGRAGGRAKAHGKQTASNDIAGASEMPEQTASTPVAITETESKTETTSTDVEVVPRKKRGTRIPDPFVVTREMREWAADRTPHVNVDLSTERFVNYWRARTRDATKLDWLATWHNWLLSDADKTPPGGKSKAAVRTENNLNVVAMFAAQEKGALEA